MAVQGTQPGKNPSLIYMQGHVVLVITPSERNALQLLAQGGALAELAGCLGIRPSEVAPHVKALFAKMGVSSHAEAISVAQSRGLVTGAVLESTLQVR